MYPDFSYILHALIGTAPDNGFSVIKTFGLFLVLAILSAAYPFYKEMIRKEKEGLLQPTTKKIIVGGMATPMELLLNGILGLFLFAKVSYIFQHFQEFRVDPASVLLSLKGNWLLGVLGAGIFAAMKFWDKKRLALPEPKEVVANIFPHDRIGDITMLAAFSGIIGAKIFALAEDMDLVFAGKKTFSELMSQFLSGSGMAIYGGLIVGFLACYIYLRIHKMRVLPVLDAVTPGLMLSYGVGRLGCQFSGDGDWGIPIKGSENGVSWDYQQPSWLPDFLWGSTYPHNVINEGPKITGCEWDYCSELASAVFPTPTYEAIVAIALAAFLWAIRKKITIPGLLFFIYVIFNGIERFFIEKIRVNEHTEYFGFQTTQAERIAIILFIIGIIGCIIVSRNKPSTKGPSTA